MALSAFAALLVAILLVAAAPAYVAQTKDVKPDTIVVADNTTSNMTATIEGGESNTVANMTVHVAPKLKLVYSLFMHDFFPIRLIRFHP
jgi:hypothetical protein